MMFKCFPVSHFLKEVPYFLTFYHFWLLGMMVLAWLCLLQGNQETFSQDIMNFAYFRSLLQLTTTIFGRTHRHTHTNKHTISWCFLLDFVHKAWWSRNRGLCVHRDSVPTFSSPFTLGFIHLQIGISLSGNWLMYPGPSSCYCLEEIFISPWYHTSFNPQGYTEQS